MQKAFIQELSEWRNSLIEEMLSSGVEVVMVDRWINGTSTSTYIPGRCTGKRLDLRVLGIAASARRTAA